jgi:hypothetical protein
LIGLTSSAKKAVHGNVNGFFVYLGLGWLCFLWSH